MSTPSWAIGMRRIAPGLYVDNREALHIDTPTFCAANGYPPTQHNIEMLERAAREMFPGVEVTMEDQKP